MRIRKDNYKKLCACGCGELIWHLGAQGKPIIFSVGHNSKAENNTRWKGGKSKTTQGYITIYKPDHHFAKRRYVMEHRLVWEEHNKAILLPWSNVHHINGIKTDNIPENLEAMMIGQHSSLHGHAEDIIDNRRCSICNNKTYLRKSGKQEWYRSPYDKELWVCRKHYRQYIYRLRK